MDIYRPKRDPRPSRRKDKDNPYEIFSVGIDTDQPHFYVSFKDGQGVQICMEIDKAVFELLDHLWYLLQRQPIASVTQKIYG